jgi:hypothetical protein
MECRIQVTSLDAVHLHVTTSDWDSEGSALLQLTPAEARALAAALNETADDVEACE